jgi:cation transport ATPase
MPFQVWLISALTLVLLLLFGVFYHPDGDARKTANRRNIAFVLLAIFELILVIRYILNLIKMIGNHDVPNLILADFIVGLLIHLTLLALAVLLLLKSGRKNIAPVAVSIIVLTIVGIIIALVETSTLYYSIVSVIAFILLAVHCLQGKAEAAEEE